MKSAFNILMVSAFLALLSCEPNQNYPDEPKIEYKDHEVIQNAQGRDSAIQLTIDYVDGDGDLGLKESQDEPPFDTGKYANNLFMEYQEQIDGEFRQVRRDKWNKEDTIGFKYRFPYITPDGKNKSIKGDLSVKISPRPYFYYPQENYEGLVKFKVYIVDRELHQSNTITTPAIPFKQQAL